MPPIPGNQGHIADPEARHRRARLAANARHHPDKPELTDERRYFKAAAAERYIKQLVDTFPPLTREQRARLATLLHQEGDAAGRSHISPGSGEATTDAGAA
jgi:hypothetical protein